MKGSGCILMRVRLERYPVNNSANIRMNTARISLSCRQNIDGKYKPGLRNSNRFTCKPLWISSPSCGPKDPLFPVLNVSLYSTPSDRLSSCLTHRVTSSLHWHLLPHTQWHLLPHTQHLLPHTQWHLLPHTQWHLLPHTQWHLLPHTQWHLLPHTQWHLYPSLTPPASHTMTPLPFTDTSCLTHNDTSCLTHNDTSCLTQKATSPHHWTLLLFGSPLCLTHTVMQVQLITQKCSW